MDGYKPPVTDARNRSNKQMYHKSSATKKNSHENRTLTVWSLMATVVAVTPS
jgi:hypothetical protein